MKMRFNVPVNNPAGLAVAEAGDIHRAIPVEAFNGREVYTVLPQVLQPFPFVPFVTHMLIVHWISPILKPIKCKGFNRMDTVSTLRDLRSREVRVRSLAATGLVGFKLGIRPGVGPMSTLWGADPGPDSQPGSLTAEGDHRKYERAYRDDPYAWTGVDEATVREALARCYGNVDMTMDYLHNHGLVQISFALYTLGLRNGKWISLSWNGLRAGGRR